MKTKSLAEDLRRIAKHRNRDRWAHEVISSMADWSLIEEFVFSNGTKPMRDKTKLAIHDIILGADSTQEFADVVTGGKYQIPIDTLSDG